MYRTSLGLLRVVLSSIDTFALSYDDTILINHVRKQIEHRFNNDGYVVKVLDIVSRSKPYNDSSSLYAMFVIDVCYKALICEYVIGERIYGIECQQITEVGILAQCKKRNIQTLIPSDQKINALPLDYFNVYENIMKINIQIKILINSIMKPNIEVIGIPFFYEDVSAMNDVTCKLEQTTTTSNPPSKINISEADSILMKSHANIRFSLKRVLDCYWKYSEMSKQEQEVYVELATPTEKDYNTNAAIAKHFVSVILNSKKGTVTGNSELSKKITNYITPDKSHLIIVESINTIISETQLEKICKITENILNDLFKLDTEFNVLLPIIPITLKAIEYVRKLFTKFSIVIFNYPFAFPRNTLSCWLTVMEKRKIILNDLQINDDLIRFNNEVINHHEEFMEYITYSNGMFRNLQTYKQTQLYKKYEMAKKEYTFLMRKRLVI
jgi:hypothetical protein